MTHFDKHVWQARQRGGVLTVKILHTADVHLREDEPKTREALEEVLATASVEDVDVVTIGGDLFDSPADAEALRPELREVLQGNPFDIVAIPGNHDEDVYKENLRFGNDLDILTDEPFATREADGLELVGVPFTSSMTEELFAALQAHSDEHEQALLLHCTLDLGFHTGATGEDEGTYFPVSRATLGELGYEYVLAGHIHAGVQEVPLANGGRFIYPGSPVSHSTKETGPRHAVLVDTATADVTAIPLETYYYDSLSTVVRPSAEAEVLNEIQRWVSQRADDDCDLDIHVDGFIERDEDSFNAALRDAAAPVEPDDETRDATPVLTHPLYERFSEKLAAREDIEDAHQVDTRVIEVLSELLVERKVKA